MLFWAFGVLFDFVKGCREFYSRRTFAVLEVAPQKYSLRKFSWRRVYDPWMTFSMSAEPRHMGCKSRSRQGSIAVPGAENKVGRHSSLAMPGHCTDSRRQRRWLRPAVPYCVFGRWDDVSKACSRWHQFWHFCPEQPVSTTPVVRAVATSRRPLQARGYRLESPLVCRS